MRQQTCKRCHSKNVQMKKEWILQGKIPDKKTGKPLRFLITLWLCRDCGKYFRTSDRIPEAKETVV